MYTDEDIIAIKKQTKNVHTKRLTRFMYIYRVKSAAESRNQHMHINHLRGKRRK